MLTFIQLNFSLYIYIYIQICFLLTSNYFWKKNGYSPLYSLLLAISFERCKKNIIIDKYYTFYFLNIFFIHLPLWVSKSPLNPFYTWYNMLLTGLHHSPVVSIPLLLQFFHTPLHLSPLLPSLTCRRDSGNHQYYWCFMNNLRLGKMIGNIIHLKRLHWWLIP